MLGLRQPAPQRISALRPASRLWTNRTAPRAPASSPQMRRASSSLSAASPTVQSQPQYAPVDKPRKLRVKKAFLGKVADLFATDSGISGRRKIVVDVQIEDAQHAAVCICSSGRSGSTPGQPRKMQLVDFLAMFNYTDVKTLFKYQFGIHLHDADGCPDPVRRTVGEQQHENLLVWRICDNGLKHFALEVLVDEPTASISIQRLQDRAVEDLPPLPHDASLPVKETMDSLGPEQKHARVVRNKWKEEFESVWEAAPHVITAIRNVLGPEASTIFPCLPMDDQDALLFLPFLHAIMNNAALDCKLRCRDTISPTEAGEYACLYTVYFQDAGEWCIKVGYTRLTAAMRKSEAAMLAGVQRAASTYVQGSAFSLMVVTCVPSAEARKTKDLVKGFLRAIIHGPQAAVARDVASRRDIIRGLPAAVVECGRWRFVDHVLQAMTLVPARALGRALRWLEPGLEVVVAGQKLEQLQKKYDAAAVACVRVYHRTGVEGQATGKKKNTGAVCQRPGAALKGAVAAW